MDKYVIIEIVDNHLNPDGLSLIVKANRIYNASEFEHLSEIFEKKYYRFSLSETADTEMFIYPFSNRILNRMLCIAKQQEEGVFWEPDLSEFYDSPLQLRDGTIKIVHKYIGFLLPSI